MTASSGVEPILCVWRKYQKSTPPVRTDYARAARCGREDRRGESVLGQRDSEDSEQEVVELRSVCNA